MSFDNSSGNTFLGGVVLAKPSLKPIFKSPLERQSTVYRFSGGSKAMDGLVRPWGTVKKRSLQ